MFPSFILTIVANIVFTLFAKSNKVLTIETVMTETSFAIVYAAHWKAYLIFFFIFFYAIFTHAFPTTFTNSYFNAIYTIIRLAL